MVDPTLEKDVQRACVTLLEGLGFGVWPTSQHRRGTLKGIAAGIPDLLTMHPKTGFVGIEVKRPGGRQSDEQTEFEVWSEHCHVEYWLVHSEAELRERLTDAGVLK